MIDFTHLSRAAGQAGLQAVDRGKGHWQVHGGTFLVNFYPFGSRGPTLYVAGSASGKRLKGSSEKMIEAVVQAASRPPRREKTEHSKRKNWNAKERRREKRRLFFRDRRCYWCRCLLVLKREDEDEERRFATIEHKVPLGAGGLENPNNRVLACEECNSSRGDSTTAPSTRKAAT